MVVAVATVVGAALRPSARRGGRGGGGGSVAAAVALAGIFFQVLLEGLRVAAQNEIVRFEGTEKYSEILFKLI